MICRKVHWQHFIPLIWLKTVFRSSLDLWLLLFTLRMLCILDRCLVLCDWAAPDGGSARARSLARRGWRWCGVMNGSCPVRRFIRRWKRLVIDGSVVFTVINSLNELAEGGLDKHAANSIVSCDCSQAARSKETFFYFLLLVFSSGSVGQTEIWKERRSEREEDNSAEMKQRRHMCDICLHFYVDVRYLFFCCISCSGKVIRAERTAGFYTSALSAEVEEASRSTDTVFV